MPISRTLDRISAAGAVRQLKRLSLNAFLQISSQVLPLVAAVIAIPIVRANMGAAEFGTFSIALSILGMFTLLDLGLGRSTVRFVARALADDDQASAAALAVQSAIFLGIVALLLCVLLIVFAPLLAEHWFEGATASQRGLTLSLYALAVALPFTAVTTVLRSVLEAREDFCSVSAIQTTIGTLTYLVPLILSFVTTHVHFVIAGAAACRIVGLLLFLLRKPFGWRRALTWRVKAAQQGEFRRFSFWLVVSNLVGLCIVYGDRALLVSLIPLARVPLYNVPLEILSRILIIVNGVVTVVFPWMARSSGGALSGRYEAVVLSVTAVLLAPVVLALSAFAPMWLGAWLGEQFSRDSSTLVRIILVGILFQGLNAVALASLNAHGRARVPALMHLIEMPLYLAALYFAGVQFGLVGIAVVWCARPPLEYLCYALLLARPAGGTLRFQLLGAALAACNAIPPLIVLTGAVASAVVAWALIAAITAAWISSALRAAAIDGAARASTSS